jgi:dTDP-4-amino-4,6-dideoxygalactose transaminase
LTIPYARQLLDDDDIRAVLEALRSEYLTQGPRIAEFENAVASYCGVRHAVAVSSGTAALHIACLAA